ncbi:MAG TPA: oligosaccharide flippase family protein, partial [Bacteroidia bacterium]|nr:oligosaccharide flippase family protein [Bacteroidia bacterium]
ARSINRIASSVVAELFKNNNFKELNKLYNQTCNAGITISCILFIGILVNIDSIMRFLPPEYISGKNVILFISAGYITEMATGINQVILYNSKYYYYDTVFLFLVVIVTIVGNHLMIPLYGIQGSAVVTAIAIASSNVLRSVFIGYKFKMQPYDMKSLKLIAIAAVTFLCGYSIPQIPYFIIDIIVRGGVVTVVFILLILKFEASPDLNKKIRKNLQRFSVNL